MPTNKPIIIRFFKLPDHLSGSDIHHQIKALIALLEIPYMHLVFWPVFLFNSLQMHKVIIVITLGGVFMCMCVNVSKNPEKKVDVAEAKAA